MSSWTDCKKLDVVNYVKKSYDVDPDEREMAIRDLHDLLIKMSPVDDLIGQQLFEIISVRSADACTTIGTLICKLVKDNKGIFNQNMTSELITLFLTRLINPSATSSYYSPEQNNKQEVREIYGACLCELIPISCDLSFKEALSGLLDVLKSRPETSSSQGVGGNVDVFTHVHTIAIQTFLFLFQDAYALRQTQRILTIPKVNIIMEQWCNELTQYILTLSPRDDSPLSINIAPLLAHCVIATFSRSHPTITQLLKTNAIPPSREGPSLSHYPLSLTFSAIINQLVQHINAKTIPLPSAYETLSLLLSHCLSLLPSLPQFIKPVPEVGCENMSNENAFVYTLNESELNDFLYQLEGFSALHVSTWESLLEALTTALNMLLINSISLSSILQENKSTENSSQDMNDDHANTDDLLIIDFSSSALKVVNYLINFLFIDPSYIYPSSNSSTSTDCEVESDGEDWGDDDDGEDWGDDDTTEGMNDSVNPLSENSTRVRFEPSTDGSSTLRKTASAGLHSVITSLWTSLPSLLSHAHSQEAQISLTPPPFAFSSKSSNINTSDVSETSVRHSLPHSLFTSVLARLPSISAALTLALREHDATVFASILQSVTHAIAFPVASLIYINDPRHPRLVDLSALSDTLCGYNDSVITVNSALELAQLHSNSLSLSSQQNEQLPLTIPVNLCPDMIINTTTCTLDSHFISRLLSSTLPQLDTALVDTLNTASSTVAIIDHISPSLIFLSKLISTPYTSVDSIAPTQPLLPLFLSTVDSQIETLITVPSLHPIIAHATHTYVNLNMHSQALNVIETVYKQYTSLKAKFSTSLFSPLNLHTIIPLLTSHPRILDVPGVAPLIRRFINKPSAKNYNTYYSSIAKNFLSLLKQPSSTSSYIRIIAGLPLPQPSLDPIVLVHYSLLASYFAQIHISPSSTPSNISNETEEAELGKICSETEFIECVNTLIEMISDERKLSHQLSIASVLLKSYLSFSPSSSSSLSNLNSSIQYMATCTHTHLTLLPRALFHLNSEEKSKLDTDLISHVLSVIRQSTKSQDNAVNTDNITSILLHLVLASPSLIDCVTTIFTDTITNIATSNSTESFSQIELAILSNTIIKATQQGISIPSSDISIENVLAVINASSSSAFLPSISAAILITVPSVIKEILDNATSNTISPLLEVLSPALIDVAASELIAGHFNSSLSPSSLSTSISQLTLTDISTQIEEVSTSPQAMKMIPILGYLVATRSLVDMNTIPTLITPLSSITNSSQLSPPLLYLTAVISYALPLYLRALASSSHLTPGATHDVLSISPSVLNERFHSFPASISPLTLVWSHITSNKTTPQPVPVFCSVITSLTSLLNLLTTLKLPILPSSSYISVTNTQSHPISLSPFYTSTIPSSLFTSQFSNNPLSPINLSASAFTQSPSLTLTQSPLALAIPLSYWRALSYHVASELAPRADTYTQERIQGNLITTDSTEDLRVTVITALDSLITNTHNEVVPFSHVLPLLFGALFDRYILKQTLVSQVAVRLFTSLCSQALQHDAEYSYNVNRHNLPSSGSSLCLDLIVKHNQILSDMVLDQIKKIYSTIVQIMKQLVDPTQKPAQNSVSCVYVLQHILKLLLTVSQRQNILSLEEVGVSKLYKETVLKSMGLVEIIKFKKIE